LQEQNSQFFISFIVLSNSIHKQNYISFSCARLNNCLHSYLILKKKERFTGESTCYVNGLDLLAWKGADYTGFLRSMVGGMAGFAYLRFKRADPPCMVYWGANPKYLMKDLANIIGFRETVIEGRTFKLLFLALETSLMKDSQLWPAPLICTLSAITQTYIRNSMSPFIMF